MEVDGPGPLSHQVTAVVEADLRPALRGRHVSIAYLQQPQPFTILLAHDRAGLRWAFGTRFSPEHESIDDYGDERVADMIRAAAGLPRAEVTLRPQIPGTNPKVLGFTIGAQVAREYLAGRVFSRRRRGARGAADRRARREHRCPGHPQPGVEARRLARFGARMGYTGTTEPLVDYAAVAYGYQHRSAAVVGAGGTARP